MKFNIKKFTLSPILLIIISWFILLFQANLCGYLNSLDDRIRGEEPIGYYVYLRSIIFDNDVNFFNNYSEIYGYKEGQTDAYGYRKKTASGYYDNPWSIGPAIAWSPFYLSAHFIGRISDKYLATNYGNDGHRNGLYSRFIIFANAIYVLIGCIVCYLFCLLLFSSKRNALISSLVILFCSQITYYCWSWLPMSHSVSFCSTAIYLYCYKKYGASKLTAVSSALMILMRWQNALFLIPQIVIHINQLFQALKEKQNVKFIQLLKSNLIFSSIIIIGIFPQLYVWKKVYGSFITIPQKLSYAGQNDLIFDFQKIENLFAVLFSSNAGLFFWNPILLIGCVGILLMIKHKKSWGIPLLSILILQWFVNGFVDIDSGAGGFGARRFCNILPIISVGIGYCILLIKRQIIVYNGIIACIILSVFYNLAFIYQSFHYLIPESGHLLKHEVIYDKFHLGKAKKAKDHATQALMFLVVKNDDKFNEYSKLAYQTYKYNRNVMAIYCYSVLKSKDGKISKNDTLEEWGEMDPNNLIPNLGLMFLYYNQGKSDSVLNLLNSLKGQKFKYIKSKQAETMFNQIETNIKNNHSVLFSPQLYNEIFLSYILKSFGLR